MPKRKTKKKFWIKTALAKRKKGALSRQLGIPEEENIPITLLKAIRDADIGKMVHNPTTKGKRRIKTTRLLKRRAVLALTLKRMKK